MTTRRGSYFMTELLRAVSLATAAAGHTVELVFDEFPPRDHEWVYVAIPHEFNAWASPARFPDARQRSRTIAFCTENPGTPWFEETVQLVPEFAGAVSINRSSTAALQQSGIRCEHLQLGYVPTWDHWHRNQLCGRPIDVLYLGAADARRDLLLAGYGEQLSARDCQLLIPPLEPRTGPRVDFLKEEEKYLRLRASKVLLNLHRTTSAALEWMRFLEAICNGCVVISEPCLDSEPLVPGEHFVEAGVTGMTDALNGLLDEPQRLLELRNRAYDFVRRELPMRRTGERLAELATELFPGRAALARPSAFGVQDGGARPSGPATVEPAQVSPERTPEDETQTKHGSQGADHSVSENVSLIARVNRLRARRRQDVRILARTPAYARSSPRISVIAVITPGHEREAVAALESVAGSSVGDLEVLALGAARDHASTSAIEALLEAHPELPAALLDQDSDDGLAGRRNRLLSRARGQYVFVLDPRGGIYPSTLARLLTALEDDPTAVFSYPMVAVLDAEGPVSLRGALPWEPERLTRVDWIDAMALFHRERLLQLGGYCTDARLQGWEDLELWCRCAEAEGRGQHVPQVLAWHRPRGAERADTDSPPPSLLALLSERFPRLFAAGGRS